MANWTEIEADFCKGVLSIRQIAKRRSVSESAIRKRATRLGWLRAIAQDPLYEPRCAPAALKPAEAPEDVAERSRAMASRLLDELDAVTTHIGELEDWIFEATGNDVNGRRRAAMLKAVSLSSRTQTLRTITQAIATLSTSAEKPTKKDQANEAAKTAADGTDWGDDLATPPLRLVK